MIIFIIGGIPRYWLDPIAFSSQSQFSTSLICEAWPSSFIVDYEKRPKGPGRPKESDTVGVIAQPIARVAKEDR